MNTNDALWASARAHALAEAGDIGGVIRLARQARGWRQEDLANAAGFSRSTISRLETGSRAGTDITMIRDVAAKAGIPPAILGVVLRIPGPPPVTVASEATPVHPALEDDPVRRRELLAGLAGVSAAALLPAPRAAATAGADPVTAALEEILASGPGPAAPVPARVLEARLAAAWRAFNACRYQALAGWLPGLIAATAACRADAAPGAARAAASAAVADAYVLASELAEKTGDDGMAWVAADRSLTAARDSGNPATIAASSRAIAIAMRRLGHYDAATSMLTRTALSLEADHGDPPAPVLAAYGSLLCTAAYASAQNGRRHQAVDLVTEAGAAAARTPDGTVTRPAFSAASVKVYQIGIYNALGDSAAALAHARLVVQAQLPTPERHARFWVDTARAWQQHGRPDQAYRALLAAERHAPEEIRRASVRTLITTMAQGPGPRPYGLRQLAGRAGAPS
jgi:transcriptional regulator with XRE-family HTH domain